MNEGLPTVMIFKGVRFQWTGATTEWWRYGGQLVSISGELEKLLAPVLHRQKRKTLTRRDVLTYLETAITAQAARLSPDWKCTGDLLPSLTAGVPDAALVTAFLEQPLIKTLHSELVFDDGSRGDQVKDLCRLNGEAWAKKPGFYPQFTLNLGEIRATPKEFDYTRLLVLIAAVEIRRHLDLYYPTRNLLLRKCHHDGCGAWFIAPRMGVRSKFCCSVCRVNALRGSRR